VWGSRNIARGSRQHGRDRFGQRILGSPITAWVADHLHRRRGEAFSCRPTARCAHHLSRAYYDQHRDRGATHYQALQALANRLVVVTGVSI
jgi:hypothetical protein